MNNFLNLYNASLIAGWAGYYVLVKKFAPKPVKFDSKDDDTKKKDLEIYNYYINYVALTHAVILVVFSKLVSDPRCNVSTLLYVQCQEPAS